MSQTVKKTLTSKIADLDQAVEWFYGDDFQLDQAISKYEATTKLAQEIKQDLAQLKNEVKVLADFTK